MSADLQWLLVRGNSSYMVKRLGGAKTNFSHEPGNLRNISSYKSSGLANNKVVDIQARGKRGLVVKTIKEDAPANTVSGRIEKFSLSRGSGRSAAGKVLKRTAHKGYRVDLTKDILTRSSRIIESQTKKRKERPTKLRGRKALLAAGKTAKITAADDLN